MPPNVIVNLTATDCTYSVRALAQEFSTENILKQARKNGPTSLVWLSKMTSGVRALVERSLTIKSDSFEQLPISSNGWG
ncbi:hypothetical protein KIN20_034199 [Parelaphostrongylus tenuis]|uniref:Uncharacterized protein n=1 Tax=Parelaphostrongylus tenuis TaxID=148309 RepID=A0AAD5R9F0_PARTN|nr:hypothetical protein KIN20_034199 [Parelaphostrongylus tenuis]